MTLAESLSVDKSRFSPIIEQRPTMLGGVYERFEPNFNPMLRCPLPPINATPDSLRQFYLSDKVPQWRLLAPPNQAVSTSGSTVITQSNTTVVQSGNTGSSGGTSTGTGTATGFVAKQASLTTATLNPDDKFVGSLLVAKAFQLLLITASAPCNIRLYGTALSQTMDLGRVLDAAPAAGTTMDLISDVVLDQSPLQWNYQNRSGHNSDSPQSELIYITIQNVGVASSNITVTILYVPIEE